MGYRTWDTRLVKFDTFETVSKLTIAVLGIEYGTLRTRNCTFSHYTLHTRHETLDTEHGTLNMGHWTWDTGLVT